jgi:hypothetical protein
MLLHCFYYRRHFGVKLTPKFGVKVLWDQNFDNFDIGVKNVIFGVKLHQNNFYEIDPWSSHVSSSLSSIKRLC